MGKKNVTGIVDGWYALLWFAVCAFIIYGQSVNFSYTYLDDHTLILNQMEHLGRLSSIPGAFREDVFHTPGGGGYYYRPLLTVSFVLDAAFGKGSLALFHVSNIVFHILATFLLFLCLVELSYDRVKSFLISLIFMLHPVVTQSVAWIPGRNDILLTIFVMAAFLCFIRYLNSGKRGYFLCHFMFWFLALLTKETAMILPFLLFPAGLFIFRVPLRKMSIFSILWIVLAIIWFGIRAAVLGPGGSYPVSDSVESLLHNLPAILPFLGKCLFPAALSVFPILADMHTSAVLGIVAMLILVVLVIFTHPKNWFKFLFAACWFILFLLPTFIKHTQTPDLTEHRVYLPLIGIILFFMESGAVRNMDLHKFVPRAATGTVILVFGILTVIHLQSFRDRYAFWNNAVETSPNHAYNYNTLGAMYFLDGDMDQADAYFRKAVAINPSEPQANSNIGLILMRKGDLTEAERFYRKEISVNPLYDNVYYNYGLLFYKKGNLDSALVEWEKTIEVNPVYTDAYQALMMIYDTLNRRDDYLRVAGLARQNGLMGPGQ
jgi:protein O-mannosyl-transferase